ncbi:MAG: hypothetical protein ACI9QQ_001675 [Myxococcota bacterium]|jgi:uncharacterized protein YbjT (DUF2867 family)
MPTDHRPVLVTGGNGQIAQQLYGLLSSRGIPGRAVVRSERAAKQVAALPDGVRPEIEILDYRDTAALTKAATGCRAIVHLVGILKEGADTKYPDAHENTCTAVAAAAAEMKLDRIVYLSIFGSRPDASNACLASKGRAEAILQNSGVATTVLRVPMVVGPDDPASRALRGQATKTLIPLIGGGHTIQQPLDIQDLLAALVASVEDVSPSSHSLDFGGPEALPHRELVARAGALYGTKMRFLTIPVAVMQGLATIFELTQKNPAITRAMLGVLQHDDRIDNSAAIEALGVTLSPLQTTLDRYIGPNARTEFTNN